jgi:hypothetical protein
MVFSMHGGEPREGGTDVARGGIEFYERHFAGYDYDDGKQNEWTERTWNPTVGCTKVSPGCKHCYAEGMASRLQAMRREAMRTVSAHAVAEPLGRPSEEEDAHDVLCELDVGPVP